MDEKIGRNEENDIIFEVVDGKVFVYLKPDNSESGEWCEISY